MARSTKSSLDRFDEDYPEGLPERLQWLEEHFGIERGRMLRLMGLPPDEAALASTRDWRQLVSDYEPQADQVEHLLTHYLAYFDYDVDRAREFAKEFSGKVATGAYPLSHSIPALASAKTAVEEDAVLLEAARQEGGSLLPALARLLGRPSDSDEENGTVARPRSPRGRRPRAS